MKPKTRSAGNSGAGTGECLLVVFFLSVRFCMAVPVVQSDLLAITIGAQGEIQGMTDGIAKLTFDSAGENFTLHDGKLNKAILLVFDRIAGDGAYMYQAPGNALTIRKQYTAHPDYISCQVTIQNTGSQQMWLATGFTLPGAYISNAIFWDGDSTHNLGTQAVTRQEYVGTFPMCCIYGKESGVALGFNPGTFFSYLETGCTKDGGISYKHRIILDPGREERIEYVMYGFANDYGFLNALDNYYKIYPQYFTPAPGIDPRAYSATESAGYSDWLWLYEQDVEAIRRLHIGWTWFYAPFRRAGDFFDRQENWEWEPKINKDRMLRISWEQARRDREAKIARAHKYDVGIMYYIIDNCEWDLANAKYKDCITVDPDYESDTVKPAWVHTYTTDTIMFWWGNKFAEDTRSDLVKIVNAYSNVIGFVVDVSGGYAKHRGAGMNETEGRAWDEKGVYISEQVGIGKMMEYIKSLKKPDGTPVANMTGGSTYNTLFRSTAPINEGGYDRIIAKTEQQRKLKYFLAGKPQVLYSPWQKVQLGEMFDWQGMSREEIRKHYGLLQNTIFDFCLYLGYYPGGWLPAGHGRFMDNLGLLYSVLPKGWQALPAMKGDPRLWYSRYGKDLDTCLAVSNPETNMVRTEVAVDNKYINDAVNVFAAYDGKGVPNKIVGGRTQLDCTLKEKDFHAWKAVLAIKGFQSGTATVAIEDDLATGRITAQLVADREAKTSGRLKLPEHALATNLLINGHQAEFTQKEAVVLYEAALVKGANLVQCDYRSTRYLISRKALLAFTPNVDTKTCVLPVVTEDDLVKDFGSDDYIAAWWVSECFRHVFATNYLDPRNLVPPSVANSSAAGNIRNSVMILGPANAKCQALGIPSTSFIAMDGNSNIVVCADTPALRKKLTKELLYLLDEKFKYYGEIGSTRWFYEKMPESKGTEMMRKKGDIQRGAVFHE